MKKIITIFCFFILVFLILLNSIDIIEGIRLSFSICINNLFPSLIPFMLISNILINYNFVNDLSDIFKKMMNNFFSVNENCAFAFIMSMISGTPSNAKYLKDLLDSNLIEEKDLQKCLNFCHFTNPIFILGTIGYTFLGNKKLGLIILISHYISSIFIGIFNKKKTIKNAYKKHSIKTNKKSFIMVLNNSINSTINTLLLILGIITTCLIITSILNKVLNLNNNLKFIYGFIEITQGLKYLSLSNLNISLKTIISSFLISFGGLCIHLQVYSILENKKIKYFPYLISRIIHGILSSIISLIFINLFN